MSAAPAPPPLFDRRLPLLLLLLLIISILSSPPVVSSGVTVTHLPGFDGPLPFHLETGYVRVDEVNDVQLFYYFVKSEKNPEEDPILVWFSGGPGCSAFCGLVFEIGPLRFKEEEYDGTIPTLIYHPYTWTKAASVIYVDSPVGTGFSFSRRPEGYDGVGDAIWAKQLHKFLKNWFIDHPEFLHNPLYLGGDSYAGKVVPIAAYEIAQGIEAGEEPLLNLKGYLLGNGFTGEKTDLASRIPYAYGAGIISHELFRETVRHCKGEDYSNPSNALCARNLNVVNKLFSEINVGDLQRPMCPTDDGVKRSLMQKKITEIINPPPVPPFLYCRSYAYFQLYYWANDESTWDALHIQKGTVREWQRCNDSLSYIKDIPSSIKYHNSVTSRGYRALVYSGDQDLILPFLGTEAWIRSLNYSTLDERRSWSYNGQVAGYTTSYSNNLTFATVKGGGHTAPTYKPEQSLAMFERWISYEPL